MSSKWPGSVRSNRVARHKPANRAATAIAERGSVLPLTMVLVALSFAAMVGLARLTVGGTDRSLAQQAADAAALAGARFDRSEAERLAAANGGALTGWSDHFVGRSHVVTVEVVFGSASATASAQWDPPPPPPPPSTIPPTSDVPTSDVPTTDVPTTDVPTTDGPGIVVSTIVPP